MGVSMVQKYRKKPVVIEAMHFDGSDESAQAICNWRGVPQARDGSNAIRIQTLEGEMTASPGDWVIKGVKGEFYPCKPDVFAATYELAD